MMLTSLLFLCLGGFTMADLRLASRPKEGWNLRYETKNKVPFRHPTFPLYMEPSAFNYQKLEQQRQRNYDNFLRSNIDNEQDNRDFDNEDGKDHLPFRSYETAGNDANPTQTTIQTKMKAANPITKTGVTEAGNYITVTEGEPYVVPLRWNNPHSAELEVNIWIMNQGAQKYVVPLMKPTCSGEGYQDNVFDFKVPKGFPNCCNKVGDCVLQVYAHSVESRMYSSGTPVIVKGATGTCTASAAKEPEKDRAFDLQKLRALCLSRADPTAHHTSAVLYKVRLSSDVYNHAYQNSDFSPYAGQQPQHISQNLQAACILKMTANNFGELGKQYMEKTAPEARKYANKIDKKARDLVKEYEKITDKIINSIKDKVKNSDSFPTSTLKADDVVECTTSMIKGKDGTLSGLDKTMGYCAKGLTCLCHQDCNGERDNGRRRRRGQAQSSGLDAYCAKVSTSAEGQVAVVANSSQERIFLFQDTETCFRCKEVGATNTKRLNTNTYIPSFEIKGKENVNKALGYTSGRQLRTGFLQNPATGTITTYDEESATLSIYMAVLTEMWKEFKMASDGTYCAQYNCGNGVRRRRRGQPAEALDLELYKFTYRGPVIKNTTATLSDANGGANRNYKKRDANNNKDGGYYSAAKAWSLQSRNGGSSTEMPKRDGPMARTTINGQTHEYPPKAPSVATLCSSGAASLMQFPMEFDAMLQEESGDETEEEVEDEDMLQAEEEGENEDEEEENDEEEKEVEDEDEGEQSSLATVDADGNLNVAGGATVDLTSDGQRPQRLMRTRAHD